MCIVMCEHTQQESTTIPKQDMLYIYIYKLNTLCVLPQQIKTSLVSCIFILYIFTTKLDGNHDSHWHLPFELLS